MEKACEGGRTVPCGEFEECLACGTKVRHDLVDHPLIGFHNCSRRDTGRLVVQPEPPAILRVRA